MLVPQLQARRVADRQDVTHCGVALRRCLVVGALAVCVLQHAISPSSKPAAGGQRKGQLIDDIDYTKSEVSR